jgi:hypothetical protein
VRRVVLGTYVLGAIGFSAGAYAQDLSAFYPDSCPESTATRWCPPLLSKEGWKLRYEAESPRDLMDVYWKYEIWMREQAAVVCIFKGGRGGIRVNDCQTLNEVEQ